tara:strand:- start:1727 stop:1906 length:180 start_codon:yes stop_codon:yes gene_type:complete
MSIKYIPVILGGIVVVVGLNVALVIRDTKMFKELDERQELIDLNLEQFTEPTEIDRNVG